MDVIEAVKGLQLETLDSDYIESVWTQEFMGDAELPDVYKEHCNRDCIEVLNEIIAAVDSWQARDHCIRNTDTIDTEECQDKSWKQLSELKLHYRALLSVLWSFITHGERNKCDEASRIVSLKAATLYLKLLAVSGSRVFHAFHPYLCLKSINVLKFGMLTISKQKKTSKEHSVGITRDEMFANDMSKIQLSAQETAVLVNELSVVIHALQLFVMKFTLETQQELLEEIVERLTEVTRLEVNTSNFMTYHGMNRSDVDMCLSFLSYSAYECLKLLCSSQHGDVEDIVIIVMKHLLPSVLLADHDLSFREQCTIREHAVHFIRYLHFTLKEVTHRGVTILIHHVFTRIGEKAETRQKGKETIVDILKIISYKQYTELVGWFFDCAHSDKASYRLLAVEVIAHLLYEEPRVPPSASIALDYDSCITYNSIIDVSTEPGHPQDNSSADNSPGSAFSAMVGDRLHKFMLAVIFARCRDSSGIVRAKALSLLVQYMKTDNMVVCSLMNEIFVLNQQDDGNEKVFLNYKQIIAALKRKSVMNPLPDARVIIDEFKNLACDHKVNVRKAALQVLESIVKLNRSWLTGSILKMLGTSCRDPAVSVRKEMVQILSDLLQQYPDDKELAKIWAKCVVPLVLDQEGKLQECVLKVMRLLIMDNLTEYSQQQDDIWYALPWTLLANIVEFDLHVCFMKACEVWVKQKEIRNGLVKDLCTHVGTENNIPAWIVLYCLSTQMDFKNPMFTVEYYRQTVTSSEASVSLLVIVLEVLLSCCGYLPRRVQRDMLNELVDSLCNYSVQRELIRLNVQISVELIHYLAESKKEARKKVKSWTGELLQRSQMYLEDTFQPDSTKAYDRDQFLCHLHTIGEVAVHNPRRVNEKTFQLLQKFLFRSEANGMRNITVDPVAKALAVVTVGKLCVLNQMWAKQAARPLVKLLNFSQDMSTIMNIIIVLRDLCVRYGAMMEPYLPSLWLCLKDDTAEVRFTALTCIVELLQGNYIKFRGALFFHLLSMLCDSDENVVEFTTYFLRDCLVATNKNIMFEHFIDGVFHYNGYQDHEVYGKCSMSREERENFLMKGDAFRESRELLYGFMLENMDDEHHMLSRNNLVMKVLGGASEGQVRLDEDGENVVLDAIHILNGKQIHLSAMHQECEDDPAADSIDKVTNILVKARSKVIAECVKKNMIDNTVPVIIHLKAVLQEKNSSLMPHLMLYVRDMMKEYKNEVKEIFAEDGQMAIEILHDIGELEKKEKQCENVQRRQENVSSRILEHIPSRINALLQSSSPWVCQSLGPEISRCYRAGGDKVVVQYAHAKLQHIRNLTQQRRGRSRKSSQSVESNEDFIREPKQEGTSEGADVEARELECGMDEILAEEEYEIRDTVEEELEVRETEEERVKGRENVEVEFGMRKSVEEEYEVMETRVEEFEPRETVEERVEDQETISTECGMRETDGELEVRKTFEKEFELRGSIEGIEDKETVEGELGMRETSEEENEMGKTLGERNETAESLDLEDEVRETEDDEMTETLGNKDEMRGIFQEGMRHVNMHVKRTIPQNVNKQSVDSETPSTSTGNITPKTTGGVSTHVPGEINITTFSSNICAVHNETLCYRPQENR